MKRIERQQGKLRPRTPSPGESPLPAGTELAAPQRDRKTGRFAPGNTASKLRALKAIARRLVGLDPSRVAPWARDFVALGNSDALKLVAQHGIEDDTALVRLAENAALTNAVARGLAVLGLQGKGNREALSEAKSFLQEYRQHLLTLKAEAREHAKQKPPPLLQPWIVYPDPFPSQGRGEQQAIEPEQPEAQLETPGFQVRPQQTPDPLPITTGRPAGSGEPAPPNTLPGVLPSTGGAGRETAAAGTCPHAQNPLACLQCWRSNPPAYGNGAPKPRTPYEASLSAEQLIQKRQREREWEEQQR